jgi:hypothetical protein
VSRYEVDLEVGPYPDPVDTAERLTGAVPDDKAPDVAFGANLRTGMVGVSITIEAGSPREAIITAAYVLGRTEAEANIQGTSTTVRASASEPVRV